MANLGSRGASFTQTGGAAPPPAEHDCWRLRLAKSSDFVHKKRARIAPTRLPRYRRVVYFGGHIGGEKLHMQSLGALGHFDFNAAGAHSYEQAIAVMRRLNLPMRDIEEQFRRTAFNVFARNQDDRVENIAFLMDKRGRWSLSPAFDVMYAYNPDGAWTSRHQMSLNGKRDAFEREDFRALERTASMKRGRADAILDEVIAAVSRWSEIADQARVDPVLADEVARHHWLEL